MKTLKDTELYYMGENDSDISIKNTSYNYVKSMLFGFIGWDKYILTEDKMLVNYLYHLINQGKNTIFHRFKIIHIGGGTNVVDLMKRNDSDNFLSSQDNVIAVLDGDESQKSHCSNNSRIFFIPFINIEKELENHYDNKKFDFIVDIPTNIKPSKRAKSIYSAIRRKRLMKDSDIFDYLNKTQPNKVKTLKNNLLNHLDAK